MKIVFHFMIIGLVVLLASCASGGKGSIVVHDQKVYLVTDGEETVIAELARSDDWPLPLLPTYAFSSDSSKIVFIGQGEQQFEVFYFGLGMKTAVQIDAKGTIDGRSKVLWSPNDSLILCNRGERIWLFDAKVDSAWKLSEPEEDWMEDYDPSFSGDGKRVFFFRGSRFEYVFSGDKYSINPDGSGLLREKEDVPTYPPEDLRGE